MQTVRCGDIHRVVGPGCCAVGVGLVVDCPDPVLVGNGTARPGGPGDADGERAVVTRLDRRNGDVAAVVAQTDHGHPDLAVGVCVPVTLPELVENAPDIHTGLLRVPNNESPGRLCGAHSDRVADQRIRLTTVQGCFAAFGHSHGRLPNRGLYLTAAEP